jgi:uncharacterized DUF497 family protein
MKIAFDPAKDALNRERHGLSLAFGSSIFEDPDHLILATIRPEDGEDRYKVVGQVDGKLYSAVYVERTHMIRFISVRRSNSHEQRAYHDD